jgi:hypothetical protein
MDDLAPGMTNRERARLLLERLGIATGTLGLTHDDIAAVFELMATVRAETYARAAEISADCITKDGVTRCLERLADVERSFALDLAAKAPATEGEIAAVERDHDVPAMAASIRAKIDAFGTPCRACGGSGDIPVGTASFDTCSMCNGRGQ